MEFGPEVIGMLASDTLNLLPRQAGKGPEYLTWVADFVSKNKNKTSLLKNPAGAAWTIGDIGVLDDNAFKDKLGEEDAWSIVDLYDKDLDDTMYRDRPNEVNGGRILFLAEVVSMQVIGAVTGTSYRCDQLVLMTCEDGKIYAFDEEMIELHMVASSIEQLCAVGLEDPPFRSYYNELDFNEWIEKW